MNNEELDRLLRRSVTPPERDAEYWRDFPGAVCERIATLPPRDPKTVLHSAPNAFPSGVHWLTRRWLPLVATLVALLVSFETGRRIGRTDPTAIRGEEIREARVLLEELSNFFPGQLIAVSLNGRSPEVVLSPTADLTASTPVIIRMCTGSRNSCQSFITFSGRQIEVDGERYDVLLTAQGDVLVVGETGLPRFVGRSLEASL